jgi:glycosyltransferase involved in cell wall biosynthesis
MNAEPLQRAHARPSLCLCIIVRDEADVLEECLESRRGLIDHSVICDTGSTDGTQELIRRSLADIPGELHEAGSGRRASLDRRRSARPL